ncbi:Na+:H+ antiporter, NhaA family [Mesorhizobium albiziae]|uniref:Na(+)/H(+) antiporter NhaA n=1 Tax=Neomesorhizobium albiziae TaxID=335020 RepID=A0A1I3UXG6_9HYPH|nr:Na+/H+ antiporter NhaA [Mesorhizobium albiziae]GLS28518.1 Na(+)/H(+) antiporter NhaA [Mesorhizobium albiziae]SFJ87403.1 Na+:H+ antiporter, NhaA family [Mesorhizobium albiziae]
MSPHAKHPQSAFREFITSESAGGIVLMVAATLALVVANSPLAPSYFSALSAYLGPLNVAHWINDGLMAVFFLLVGLEIKREFLDGQLSTWPRRILPGIAAAGGMAAPALIFVALNSDSPETLRGWAIPTATDIAFALGVLSLLGNRVPASLKVFLTALAIIDDLGAVIIIALFYTSGLSLAWMAAAAAILAALVALNRFGVMRLAPYLVLGLLLWVVVLKSGVHATLAGVALALTIPLGRTPGVQDHPADSPLHTLEHALHKPVSFFVIPVFGFANAGVPLGSISAAYFLQPLTLGITLGLVLGKLIGVFGTAWLAIRFGLADMPANASMRHLLGVAFLCGIGFTMSLFIGLLAFPDAVAMQGALKVGILSGSLVSGLLGVAILLFSPRTGGPSSR